MSRLCLAAATAAGLAAVLLLTPAPDTAAKPDEKSRKPWGMRPVISAANQPRKAATGASPRDTLATEVLEEDQEAA